MSGCGCGCNKPPKGNFTYIRFASDDQGSDFAKTKTEGAIERCFQAIITSPIALDEESLSFESLFSGKWFDICNECGCGCQWYPINTPDFITGMGENGWNFDASTVPTFTTIPAVENEIFIDKLAEGDIALIENFRDDNNDPIVSGNEYCVEFDLIEATQTEGSYVILSFGDGFEATTLTINYGDAPGTIKKTFKASTGTGVNADQLSILFGGSSGIGTGSLGIHIQNLKMGPSSCCDDSIDLDTWRIPETAFVHPDGEPIGVVGNGHKPFSDVFEAANAVGVRHVVFLPAEYTDMVIDLEDEIHYWSMPGVVFSTNTGFADFDGGKIINFKGDAILGKGCQGLAVFGDSIINFEFDRAIECDSLLIALGDPEIHWRCNSMTCTSNNGGAAAITIRDQSRVFMKISEFYEAQHYPFFFRGSATPYFSGTFKLVCPRTEVVANYTTNQGNVNKAVIGMDGCNGAAIEVIGDLVNSHDTVIGPFGGCIVWANSLDSAGWTPTKFKIKGDMYGGNNACISIMYRASLGELSIRGNMESDINPIYTVLSGVVTGDFKIDVSNSRVIGLENIIGRGKEIFFRDCSFYNNDLAANNSPNFSHNVDGTDLSIVYFHNCVAEADGVTSEFLENFATVILGCLNTYSNKVLGVGAIDTYAGHTVVATLEVPKI